MSRSVPTIRDMYYKAIDRVVSASIRPCNSFMRFILEALTDDVIGFLGGGVNLLHFRLVAFSAEHCEGSFFTLFHAGLIEGVDVEKRAGECGT